MSRRSVGGAAGRDAPAAGVRGGSGAMFDGIARRYDLLNRLSSLGMDQGWRRAAVRSLELGERAQVLDLATGTGDLALMILDRHPDAEVIGIDPSTEMLEIGRSKAAARKLSGRLRFEVGRAESLPLGDDSVDAVTIAFGIRNVPDRASGLREMARVTRPGGRVAILELGEPRGGVLAPLARLHVGLVVPALGALLSGAREYRYLRESMQAFPAPADFAGQMERAGLEVLQVRKLGLGACHLFIARPRAGAGR